MAAATLHQDRATAGQQMIASVNPQEWAESLAAIRLFRANQRAVEACQAKARTADRRNRAKSGFSPTAKSIRNIISITPRKH